MIINPLAGIGGPLAHKGSDDRELSLAAIRQGARGRGHERAEAALRILLPHINGVRCLAFAGAMGGDLAQQMGFNTEIVGAAQNQPSSADDTIAAAQALQTAPVDIIVFVGGDGTARNLCEAVGCEFAVPGVPSGVKMHSGVFAISPQAAGEILLAMVEGKLVDISHSEVRDLDEALLREGRIKTRFFGELLVPRQGHFLQHVKSAGRENETLVLHPVNTASNSG